MARGKSNLWWGPPKNFDDRRNERKISWLELFYDLVYVAAISRLTHHLAAHPSWTSVAISFLMFSLIFWSWINGSQYYDLHGNDSIRTRVFTFLQMLAIAAIAITLEDAMEGHHHAFVIAFLVIQLLITYLWWSVGLYDPSHRIFNKFYTFNYLGAFALLVISLFTTHKVAIILWIVTLVLNLTPAYTGARTIVRELKRRGQVFSASAALIERFGLFTIIVLAESILGIVSGIAAIKDKEPVAWIAFILAIFIAFLLWSIYFDMTSEQEAKKGYSYLQGLIILHYPLLASFSVAGACMSILLSDLRTGSHGIVLWMFCIALAVMLVTIVAIAAMMEEEAEDRAYIRPVSKLLFFAALAILIVPFFAPTLNTLMSFAIISGILFIPVFVGIRSWVRFKFFQ